MKPGERAERLAAFGTAIADKRDEAVKARAESGIEKVWMAAEEAYLGIDDANRGEFAGAKWAKPSSMEGPIVAENSGSNGIKSTVFVRLTSRYVDAGAARMGEILNPIDDKPFSMGCSPDPELIKNAADLTKLVAPNGGPILHSDGQTPMTVKDIADSEMDKAKDCAEKAETRIWDWLVGCNYTAESRKVTHDACRIGVGVLKGPVPDIRQSQSLSKTKDGGALQIIKKVVPVVRWIDPWNLFPDGACGENIHDGEGILERDHLSSRALKKLKGQDGYIVSQIDKVLKEGPGKCYEDGKNLNDPKTKKRFEVWYYTGSLSRDDMALADAIGIEDLPEDQKEVHAIITLVNDSVIRATINPLDSGKFPYYAMPWSRRAGSWAGVGVGEQIVAAQRICNAATRRMLDNAGNSAGLQIVIDQESLIPADGQMSMSPNKIWYKAPGATVDDVRKIFMSVEFPNLGPQLMAIIEYSFRLAEEASNIPLLAQGQQGQKMPDTFGAAELLNTNANTLLRSIAYAYDDFITEPMIHGFYEWLLLDPDVPDDEKGDWDINAHGSSALVERAIQEQVLMQMMQMSANPAFGIDPKKIFSEMARSKRIDPRKIQYTEEEMKQMAKTPPPPPVQIAVEQLKGQNALKLQQAEAQTELQQDQQEMQHEQQMLQSGGTTPHMAMATGKIEQERIKAQTAENVEASRANAENMRAEKELEIARQNGEFKIQEMQLQERLALLQYAHENQQTLAQVKADLAQTAIESATKKELAAAEIQLAQSEGNKNRGVDLHKHTASLINDQMSTNVTP